MWSRWPIEWDLSCKSFTVCRQQRSSSCTRRDKFWLFFILWFVHIKINRHFISHLLQNNSEEKRESNLLQTSSLALYISTRFLHLSVGYQYWIFNCACLHSDYIWHHLKANLNMNILSLSHVNQHNYFGELGGKSKQRTCKISGDNSGHNSFLVNSPLPVTSG